MSEKQRLVVIGNGMAGARVVEEVLTRGGGEQYAITVFGDEPYGNYNRILLSGVLAGTHQPEDIFLNPLAWYEEHGVTLHAGVRVLQIDRHSKKVYAAGQMVEEYDKLVLATGSSPFVPPLAGLYAEDTPLSDSPPQGGRRLVGNSPPQGGRGSVGNSPPQGGRGAVGSSPPQGGRGAVGNSPPQGGRGSVGNSPPQGGRGPERYKDGVFVFRTIEDCSRIAAYAGGAKRAAVIGGGLLGLEAARGLLNLGVEVDVVHLMSYLMEVQLDPSAGAMLQGVLEGMGVRVHLETATSEVLGNGHVTGLGFKDGSSLDCDLVVVSAGIRPNVELAKQAGLNVERGIVVHNDLSTRNDPDIYAIGECAQHRGLVYGLVAPAWEQAAVLGDVLTGKDPRAAYHGSKLSTKLKIMGVDLAVIGEKEPNEARDEVVTYVEPSRGVYKKLIVRGGKLAGAILLGDGSMTHRLLQAFDAGEDLPESRAELLFPISLIQKPAGVEGLPDSAQICNCNGVSKGRLVEAVRDGGCRTMKALCDATRAGTGCGSCKPEVQAVLEMAGNGLITKDPSAHYYVPGVPLTKPDLVEAIRGQGLKSVSAVFAALADGVEDPASKVGLASLLKTLWGKDYEDERDARFINDRVHANIQRDGTFSVVPRIYGGVTSAAELRRIADVADKYKVPMVKVTGGQRIDLLGIAKEDLPAVWQDLGIPSGHAYTKAFRTCKTCVGTEFCRYGVGNSVQLGIEIEKRFQGIESPHKMKLAASGCPRNCAESTTKDLGAVGIEGGRWEVYIGGAAGSKVRKGDILCVVETHDDVLKYMGRFMQYYRLNAKYLERTYDFVERVGIGPLRRLLVEDAEGIGAELDAAIQTAVDAYVDPWSTEAQRPVHPEQFRRELVVAGAAQ